MPQNDKIIIGKCSHCEKDIYEDIFKRSPKRCSLADCEGRKKIWEYPLMCDSCSQKYSKYGSCYCKPCMDVLMKCCTCKQMLKKTDFEVRRYGSELSSECTKCNKFYTCYSLDKDSIYYAIDMIKLVMERNDWKDHDIDKIFNTLSMKRKN